MKFLFISRHIPYKKGSGISVKLSDLLSCLTRVCTVTCAFIVDEDQYVKEIDKCDLDITNYYIKSKSETNPVIRYTKHLFEILFVFKEIKKELRTIIRAEKPDAIWLEFGYICHLIPFLRQFNLPIIYCSHNSQFELDFQIWRTNESIPYRLKMAPHVALYYLHERFFFGMADLILCISHGDIEYYDGIITSSKLRYFPIFFDDRYLSTIQAAKPEHPFICIVGSLKSYQNYSAALYALEALWPIIQRENHEISLYVIGELPPVDSAELKKLMLVSSRLTNVIFTGQVDSVIPYVKAASVSIAPTLIGSGIRTKIIESVACRTPVVSTSIGAEGLPFTDGHSIHIGDDPQKFAEKVLQLIGDHGMRNVTVSNAYGIYQEHFSHEAGVRRLSTVIDDLVSQPGRTAA